MGQISLELATDTLTSAPPISVALIAVLRCSVAHRTAARRPFCTSTANQIIRLAEVQRITKKGKPSQLLPDLLMIAWITLGPIIDDAVLDSPNRLKNCISPELSKHRVGEGISGTYHIVEARWRELGHHCLRESIVRNLKKSKYDIVRPELPYVVKSVNIISLAREREGTGIPTQSCLSKFRSSPIAGSGSSERLSQRTELISIDAFSKNTSSDCTIFFVLIFQ